MGLYFNGEARDRCWGRGMFRGYVSGYVSGVCFGYVSRHHELLYLQFRGMLRGMFRGYVSGYVTGYVSRVCNPCALLKPEPPKKHKPTWGVYEQKGLLTWTPNSRISLESRTPIRYP